MSDNERADHRTRFKKGQSGNPGGRPKGRKNDATAVREVLFKPMRVKDGNNYVLIGSQGGAPTDPAWVQNLRANPQVEIRDQAVVGPMRVREVENEAERSRLWGLAVAAFPPYAEYQERTARRIPVFVAEPSQ